MGITIDKDLDWNKQIEKLSSALCTYNIILIKIIKLLSHIYLNQFQK